MIARILRWFRWRALEREALALHRQMVASGVPEEEATAAIVLAMRGPVLRSGGPDLWPMFQESARPSPRGTGT